MNDQEIRMWAVEQAMSEWRDADLAIAEAQRLYLFVTGKGDKQTHSNAAATPPPT
jgi:hypothetical protein